MSTTSRLTSSGLIKVITDDNGGETSTAVIDIDTIYATSSATSTADSKAVAASTAASNAEVTATSAASTADSTASTADSTASSPKCVLTLYPDRDITITAGYKPASTQVNLLEYESEGNVNVKSLQVSFILKTDNTTMIPLFQDFFYTTEKLHPTFYPQIHPKAQYYNNFNPTRLYLTNYATAEVNKYIKFEYTADNIGSDYVNSFMKTAQNYTYSTDFVMTMKDISVIRYY